MLAGCCIVYLIEGGTYCILSICFVAEFRVSFRRILLVVMCCASVLTGVAERLSFDQFYALVLNYLGEDELGDGLDVGDLELRLRRVYDNPIEWNGASRRDFEELGFVSDMMVEELLFYADYYGPVRSIGELKMVHDIESPLLLLLPTVMIVGEVSDTAKWGDAFRYLTHRVVVRSDVTCEPRKGYETGYYKGGPFRLLSRYDFGAGDNFRVGVAMESDAGEPWNRGFDLYRMYVEASNLDYVSRVVVGSYRVGFGRGLLFGQQRYGSRLSQVLDRGNSVYGIRGYGGVSEMPGLVGGAVEMDFGGFRVTPFYGCTVLDADTIGGRWRSYSTTGYHRSELEISRRGTVDMHTAGVNVGYRGRFWSLGATGYGGFFSLPFDGRSNVDFEGDRQWGASVDYSVNRRRMWFSGEVAMSQDKGVATTNTLLIRPLKELQFVLNYRYFSPRYHVFWGNTVSSLSGVNGEHGMSVAMQIPVGLGRRLSFLADVYKDLRESDDNLISRVGYELRGEFEGPLGDKVDLKGVLRYKARPGEFVEEGWQMSKSSIDRVVLGGLKVGYEAGGCDFVTGLQMNIAQEKVDGVFVKPKFGYLFYQDVGCGVGEFPLRLKARMALYGAPTWANRFYLYEADVPMSGYTPALYGSAFRWYLMADYKFKFGLTMALRVAQTAYSDREVIGSSHDLISSNHRTDVHIVLSYKIKTDKNRWN